MEARSPSAASGATGSVDLSDAAASPVSTASSILRLEARKSLRVGGNAVARFGQNDVADHEAFGGNRQSPPIAQDRGLAREHRANGLERLFRTPFLDQSDRRVDEDDGEDDHGVESVTQDDGDEGRSEEDIDEEVVELSKHAREPGAWFAGRQAVRPVRFEPPRGFVGAQAFSRGPAELERGLGQLRMPGAFRRRG